MRYAYLNRATGAESGLSVATASAAGRQQSLRLLPGSGSLRNQDVETAMVYMRVLNRAGCQSREPRDYPARPGD